MPATSTGRALASRGAEAGATQAKWAAAHSLFCLLVFAMLYSIPLFFAFAYHAFPVFVLTLMALIVIVSLSPLFMARGSVLAGGLLASVLAMMAFGMQSYYAYALPLHILREGKGHVNAYAQEATAVYQDAASIQFAGDARVDESQAVGMTSLEDGAHVFCVAPVLDSQSHGRVSFWAVGVDCCGRAGNFRCGDAGDSSASGGFVLADAPHDILGGAKYFVRAEMRRDIFIRAIKQAEARASLVSSKTPILLDWSKMSRSARVTATRGLLAGNLTLLVLAAAGLAAASTAVAALAGNLIPTNDQFLRDKRAAGALGLPQDTSAEVANFVTKFHPGTSRSTRDVALLGFALPFLVFIISVVVWSWMWCWKYGDFLSVIFAGLWLAIASTLAFTPQKREYSVLVLLAAYAGCYIGQMNYTQNVSHYCNITNRRTYSNVPADAPASEYRDAGKLNFASSAHIGSALAVGFHHRGSNFCAAPIVRKVSENATHARADFWAVGVDCCEARGDFRCGGSPGKVDAGLVIHRAGANDQRYSTLLRAVRAAADLNKLSTGKDPVLLAWREDLEVVRQTWLGQAVSTCFLADLVAFGILGAFALASGSYGRSLQKQEQRVW